ncbi:MAG: SDR family NAD(P)-dependent oxidoreductase [Actinobacteria bacterium]|nr:SDR family NAD(P)-dependent oxidoreductase [Actinomycetota bacterium]MBU4240232.1 SDR family NAD(P)-dependent oxidoreductase [Actinomycetota bacterium]MBU4302645.1 SDR family NAD(P)-dependent oxidoreductase [Actinomycetota bacterium]MBU4490195.1 SDR family NAD(P)-dependent oxidoreductase [Actinomycetota bacterium]MCG2794504.1 SDR family NAD(P)-dependent oxidoreductase [Actinomycetes bacterium]
MKEFSGKVVVVTGAASGIGREIALAFARRGARLVIGDINGDGLRAVGEELEALGTEFFAEVVDVSQAWQMEEFCETTYKRMGRVDVLCNNAGIGLGGAFEDLTLDDLKLVMGVNLWGVIHGCHFFYPRMIEQGGGGHIVNTSSGAALAPIPMLTAYTCTKCGVLGLSEDLRGEAALHGIGVTALCPGIISTNIMKTTGIRARTSRWSEDESRGKLKWLMEKRGLLPSKVAEKVVRGVERNKGVVRVGPETYLIDIVHRVSRHLNDSILKFSYWFIKRWF